MEYRKSVSIIKGKSTTLLIAILLLAGLLLLQLFGRERVRHQLPLADVQVDRPAALDEPLAVGTKVVAERKTPRDSQGAAKLAPVMEEGQSLADYNFLRQGSASEAVVDVEIPEASYGESRVSPIQQGIVQRREAMRARRDTLMRMRTAAVMAGGEE